MNNIKLLSFFVALLFYTSCTSDKAVEQTTAKSAVLEGRWELVEGYRSGKKTESLAGTYFDFSENTMSTNLPIKGAMNSAYTKKENVLSQTIINDMTIDYTIEELSEQHLKLTSKLRGLDFTFVLERKQKEQ